MKVKITLLSFFLFFTHSNIFSQQQADQEIPIHVENPTFSKNGPLIVIDGGHNNFHKVNGRFEPFARLMRADGYRVDSIIEFKMQELEKADILVIANPLNSQNIGNWKNPCPSAYSEEEIKTVKKWVKGGGHLLLIADHMPFGGAAKELGQAFGFEFTNGFSMAEKRTWPPESFDKTSGNLAYHPITEGISKLASFTGSAFKAPKKATILTLFPEGHQVLSPEVAWQFNENTPVESAKDFVHGAILQYGKGRIAVFAEAAMFTAQVVNNNNGIRKFGFNAPEAPDNQQFILNLMHWLDGQ